MLIAAGVHVPSGAHTHGMAEVSVAMRDQPSRKTPVRIGAGSWIGSAAVVMADVGKDAVVGAGAVVTRPIADRVIAGGVPARVLRERGDGRPAIDVRVLFLTHRLPYAPNRGDRLRAYHILQWLRDRASVELVSLVHDDEEAGTSMRCGRSCPASRRCECARFAITCGRLRRWPPESPLTHTLLDAPGIEAALTGDRASSPARRRVCVWLRHGDGLRWTPPLSGMPAHPRSGRCGFSKVAGPRRHGAMRRYRGSTGARLARSARSRHERRPAPSRPCRQRSRGGDRATARAGRQRSRDRQRRRARTAASAGGAIRARARRLLRRDELRAERSGHPVVHQRGVADCQESHRSGATLAVVGADPGRSFQALCARDHTIELTGRVPDVRPWLWESAVAIAPLHVARGVQNKALEAIACGLPIVITSAVAAGLSGEVWNPRLPSRMPLLNSREQ